MNSKVMSIMVTVLLLLPLLSWGHESSKPVAGFLNEGDIAPDFTLTDQHNNMISLKDFEGRPVFVTFIYTNCPKECPLILQNRQGLKERIEKEIGKEGMAFLALTVDPDVDTPEVLKDYAKALGIVEDYVYLLTGKPEDVKHVLVDYGINVEKNSETGQVSHATGGYAINDKGAIDKIIMFNFSTP